MTAAAESSSVPSISAAESRYLVAIWLSGSHSQVTSGFLGSSSTLTGVPSCGHWKLLKAWIASGLGLSIHFSGSATSSPPSGAGVTGALVGVGSALGSVVAVSLAPAPGEALSDG